MFWRFGGYANISTIDTLLDKPDTTLEELLDDADLLQELKQHNTKLIEYLRAENVLRRLLEYIIAPKPHGTVADPDRQGAASPNHDSKLESAESEGPSSGLFGLHDVSEEEREKEEKTRLKYANVACEILSSETRSVIETLMENQQHLRQFWTYLKRDSPLDPLEAGYFTKVNENLLDKKTEEMLGFLKTMDDAVQSMLRHVDCPVVMDLLLKIISLEKAEGGQGIVEWLHAHGLIPGLLSYLSAEYPSATQTSAGDFLKAVITISANASQNEQSCIGPNDLTRQLVSEPCIENLIGNMLHGGSALTVGVGVIIEVIRKNNSDYDPDVAVGLNTLPSSRDPIYLGTLLRIFARHIPDFMSLILNPKSGNSTGGNSTIRKRELKVASGNVIEPLGFDRFKTCELMAELLHCSNMALLNEPGSENYIKQRDRERERLKSEGVLPYEREFRSATDFADNSMDFSRNSAPAGQESASLQESRRLEVANGGDEDGFEDVTISGILNDVARDEFDDQPEVEKDEEMPDKDDHVEGPRDKDEMDVSEIDGSSEPSLEQEGRSPTQSKEAPLSPTSMGMTAKVEAMRLNQDRDSVMKEASHLPHAMSLCREGDTEDISPVQSRNPRPLSPAHKEFPRGTASYSPRSPVSPASPTNSASPGVLSPHFEDEPAPLFSSRTEPFSPTRMLKGEAVAEANPKVDDNAEPINTTVGDEGGSTRRASPGNEAGYEPLVEPDVDGSPVVGDYLKMVFVEQSVVPTILDFFFRFPWNNFLHNVVYDVVQQVFNGPMDRGYNRTLAIDLFDSGRITDKIVEGQQKSDEAQAKTNMRLGYMGHLTLIAEEVVKFTERHPPEFLSKSVLSMVMASKWVDYVEHTLAETRERDNAILGGVRPDMSVGPRQAVINSLNAAQGFGNGPSVALANAGLTGGAAGLDSIDLINSNGAPNANFSFTSNTLQSGFGSSSDEEDEEMEDETDAEDSRPANSDGSNNNPHSPTSAPSGVNEPGSSAGSSSTIPKIPPPPPPPLNVPPSRARRQLAARLAMKLKAKQEEEHAADPGRSKDMADPQQETSSVEDDVEEGLSKALNGQQTESDIWTPRGDDKTQSPNSSSSSTSSSDDEEDANTTPAHHGFPGSSRPNAAEALTRSVLEAGEDDEDEEEGEVVDYENGDNEGLLEDEEDSGELVEIKTSSGRETGKGREERQHGVV